MIKGLILLSLILFGTGGGFAQSRPKIDGTLQKANKRSPQTTESPKPEDQPASQNPSQNQTPADSSENAQDGEVLRIDTNLVTIPVRVSDRNNKFIAGLKKEDFKVFEDGKEQEIAYFSNAEEPFTVALVLDMSYSSTFKINEIQTAAMDFINQLHPNDKVLLVSFDEEVHVLSEPTNDRKVLQLAIRGTKVASGTSLYEAVDLVVNQRLKKIPGRKAVVLFTDGVDTTSRRVFASDNLRDVYELDALIYPIEYDTFSDVQKMKNNPVINKQPNSLPIPGMPPRDSSQPRLPVPVVATPSSQGTSAEDYRKADEYLQELATSTSGRVYNASTTANLAAAFTNIANELRQIYSLGFYPTEQKNGKRRQLKVRVNQTGVAVRARDSYVVGKREK